VKTTPKPAKEASKPAKVADKPAKTAAATPKPAADKSAKAVKPAASKPKAAKPEKAAKTAKPTKAAKDAKKADKVKTQLQPKKVSPKDNKKAGKAAKSAGGDKQSKKQQLKKEAKPKHSKPAAAKQAQPQDGKAKTQKKKLSKAKIIKKDRKTAAEKVAKAQRAARAIHKGAALKRKTIRTSVHFRKPKTLELARRPKYPRKSTARRVKLDQFRILRHPLTTESAMKRIEDHNTLVFIVDVLANKYQIANAVKQMHQISPIKINTLSRPDGQKKAFVRLPADVDGLDVANKIGII